ncbi:MAG: hypothetical protein HYY16_16115, partial [Planctomycetes bacterium]|nr:hypothetical protein [Planctomycetota bacterium]
REAIHKRGTPIVSDKEALFVLEAPGAKEVLLAGDFTDWQSQPRRLDRVDDVFYLRLPLDRRARIEYQFIVDGTWKTDPWNARNCDNGLGGVNSWFGMPGYVAPATLPATVRKGRVEEAEIGGHKVWVYLPPDYTDRERYATMYFQDGQDYLKRADAAGVFDALISSGAIPPVIGVFIAPVDRGEEYWCNADYTRIFVEELVPWVDGRYATRTGRDDRGIMGASLGGLISVHLAYEHPRKFGRVASQSGAFYSNDFARQDGTKVQGTKLFDRVRASRLHPSRMHVTVGRYEWLLEDNRAFTKLLTELKVTHAYEEYFHGHTWTFWKEQLPAILTYLWKP